MSTIASTINMLPAMQELCKKENTRPSSSLSLNSAPRSLQPSSRAANSWVPIESAAFAPLLPENYSALIEEIGHIIKHNLAPQIYLKTLIEPFYKKFVFYGKDNFTGQLKTALTENSVHAILQNFGTTANTLVSRQNTEALREVISDLYQKFLISKYHFGITVVHLHIPSPIPNWTQGKSLPSPMILNVPLRYAAKGTLAWGCLGRNVLGHDILEAFPRALEELSTKVETALKNNKLDHTASHWLRWLEVATSDVLGVLNMGPASAFSLIGLLRTLGRTHQNLKLSSYGYINDNHAADLMRGFLVAYVVQLIPTKHFANAPKYAKLIMHEVEKDAQGIDALQLDTVVWRNSKQLKNLINEFLSTYEITVEPLDSPIETIIESFLTHQQLRDLFIKFLIFKGLPQTTESVNSSKHTDKLAKHVSVLPLEDFKKSAQIIAQTIMTSQLTALENTSFSDIRCWGDQDEKCLNIFKKRLKTDTNCVEKGGFAAHVVSAAIMESISETSEEMITQTKLQRVFNRMITILQTMHKANKEWK